MTIALPPSTTATSLGVQQLASAFSPTFSYLRILRNLIIPMPEGHTVPTARVDAVLVCETGVYLFEIKAWRNAFVYRKKSDQSPPRWFLRLHGGKNAREVKDPAWQGGRKTTQLRSLLSDELRLQYFVLLPCEGIELEGVMRPARGIAVTFSGSWLDARYRHFFTDAGATDLTGNRVQRQPVWQWRVMPNWDFTLAGRTGALHATFSYMGDRWSDVQNQQLLPHFYKFDAGATLDVTRRLRIELVADNLTNVIGLTEGNPRTVGSQGSGPIFARPIPGRSAEISARLSF